MWKCLKCGRILIKLSGWDELANFRCPNDWCNSYFTLKYLEDEREKNEGEDE